MNRNSQFKKIPSQIDLNGRQHMASTQSYQIKMAGMLKLVKNFHHATSKLKTIVYYLLLFL